MGGPVLVRSTALREERAVDHFNIDATIPYRLVPVGDLRQCGRRRRDQRSGSVQLIATRIGMLKSPKRLRTAMKMVLERIESKKGDRTAEFVTDAYATCHSQVQPSM